MCGYYLGASIAAWVTFGTRMVCPILALPALLIVPESPHWLVATNRTADAREASAYLHTSEDTNSPVVNHQLIDIQHTLKLEKHNSLGSGYAEMISTPGNRHRLFIHRNLHWILCTMGRSKEDRYNKHQRSTPHLPLSSNLEPDLRDCRSIAGGKATLRLPGSEGGFYTTQQQSVGTAVVPFLFIYFACYDIVLTPLLTACPCEVWPLGLRSHGLSVAWVSVVFGTMFNTFVNPIALDSIGSKYCFVFVAEFTVFFGYAKTRGHTLEDMAMIFDNDGAIGNAEVEGTDKNDQAEFFEHV
ncbi:sugar transporter (hexose transporter) [Penicillium citrinum]|uniref:Sugar transporter (Hexose transporter) n=1 Tax=Penicillium citrinum TaxID=5077 RepID=A0A9W9NBB6_PENCI|nr:sugar transporter (hexose transporter) [Penicillium citrinum]KAJ5216674.1 sugar transporter (hexose transporter) [Penicillium citrinum]